MTPRSTLCRVAALVAIATVAHGQNFPIKPIRLVTAEAGGSGDFIARLVAPELAGALGQPVVIDNRGGVATIPAMIVANAPPDGYTLILYSNGLWTGPLMEARPYNMGRDFAPVALIGISPNVLVVNAQLPAKSVAELIALAKSKPGALNYATGAVGGSGWLASEIFRSMARLDMVRVGYKGVNLALNAVISGESQIMFPGASGAAPFLKSGKLRGLAVTSSHPSELAPGLPPVSTAGLPGYEAVAITGLFARAGTPAPTVIRINRDVEKIVNSPAIRETLLRSGLEASNGPPSALAAMVGAEMVRLRRLIAEGGIRAD
jgi:tripartite-type tricarboxylate transporter receptor subunit TctC